MFFLYFSFVNWRFKYAKTYKILDLFKKMVCESMKKYIHTILYIVYVIFNVCFIVFTFILFFSDDILTNFSTASLHLV